MQNKDFLLKSIKLENYFPRRWYRSGRNAKPIQPRYIDNQFFFFFSSSCQFSGDSGIFVSKIKKHSAADRAGLEIGDKIISVI